MRLKLYHVLDLASYKMDLLLPLCYLSRVQNPEPLGIKTGALAIYIYPSQLILHFSQNVSVTDALGWYGLVCFVHILRF